MGWLFEWISPERLQYAENESENFVFIILFLLFEQTMTDCRKTEMHLMIQNQI